MKKLLLLLLGVGLALALFYGVRLYNVHKVKNKTLQLVGLLEKPAGESFAKSVSLTKDFKDYFAAESTINIGVLGMSGKWSQVQLGGKFLELRNSMSTLSLSLEKDSFTAKGAAEVNAQLDLYISGIEKSGEELKGKYVVAVTFRKMDKVWLISDVKVDK